MDSFNVIKLFWLLSFFLISQTYIIQDKESASYPNVIEVAFKSLESIDVGTLSLHTNLNHKVLGETPQYPGNTLQINSANNMQVQRERSKRYKRWGWNPVNVVKKTFSDVKNDVNKAIVSVQKVGQHAVGTVKSNAEKAIVVLDKTGKDTIVVIQRTGEDAMDKVKNTSKTVFFTVHKTGKSIVGDIDNLAAGSINVIHINGVRVIAVISKNVIEPVRSQAEIIINDEATMRIIRKAALEGSCAIIGTVTGVPGAIITGVACELLRQIEDEGFDAVAAKIKNGDLKFILKLVLKGACGGVTAKLGPIGAVASEEVCTIIEIVIDNYEILKDKDKLALKLGLDGACGGMGSLGGARTAGITAVGCSVASDMNDQGKII